MPGPRPRARKHSRADVPPTLLVDINVVLDVVLERAPWHEHSGAVLDAISRGHAVGFVAGHTITTLYYIVARANGAAAGATAVADLLQTCDVVPLDAAGYQRALALGLADFEDAAQAAAALQTGADYLVSRNEKDFKGAQVAVRSPTDILALLSALTRGN